MRHTKGLPKPIQHTQVCAVCAQPILPNHEVWMWTPVTITTAEGEYHPDIERGYVWHIEHGEVLPRAVYKLADCLACKNSSRWARRRCKECDGVGQRIDIVQRTDMGSHDPDDPVHSIT